MDTILITVAKTDSFGNTFTTRAIISNQEMDTLQPVAKGEFLFRVVTHLKHDLEMERKRSEEKKRGEKTVQTPSR